MKQLSLSRSLALSLCLSACSEYSLFAGTSGNDGAAGLILIEPPILDFGVVEYGSGAEQGFILANVGGGTLEIASIASNHEAFTLDLEEVESLEPDEVIEGTVTYQPRSFLDAGRLIVESNDPEAPVSEVKLYGGGGGDAPVAVCSANPDPVAAIHETVYWIGSGSFDPGGGGLSYAWSLISPPAGASPTLPLEDPSYSDRAFIADVVGTYTVQLVVTNGEGVSSTPCTTSFEAIPATDLWVEMFWQRPDDDMDLHVVRGNGDLRTDQDCYYANCRLDGLPWGPAGAVADPILDIDDIPGTGPENINIDAPEDIVYHVWVNDFPGSSRTEPNDVTVRIYLSGSLAYEQTKTISGEDDDVRFADVDWGDQRIDPR
ncbi:MAG TPA: hypothetical protein ENK18_25920 [Deltaproteobacteria bacterium]|nr:hypothetical protein [Deltaproteobacteria bacterium]